MVGLLEVVAERYFCVFAQYFGGGKTTLGKVFPTQVQQKNVREFVQRKLQVEPDLKAE
jgi:hypothetical protein